MNVSDRYRASAAPAVRRPPREADGASDRQRPEVTDRVTLGASASGQQPSILSATGAARYARVAALGEADTPVGAAARRVEALTAQAAAAQSRIRDADFAYESASLGKRQIALQKGVEVLGQANQLDQGPLRLIG